MPDRAADPFVKVPDDDRMTAIPEPSTDALTYRGEALSAGLVMRLWHTGQRLNQRSRARILEARSYERREESSLIALAQSWARANPEAARWVVDVRPERTTIPEVLTALAGAVEPEYVREPLGFLDRDHDDAEACQAWLEEWRRQDVPIQPMFGKAVADGQFGWEVLPTFLDREGCPTFFECLEEDAYATLSDDKKKEYRKDDDDRAGKRYVKVNSDGTKRVRPEYGKKQDAKSEKAHKDALARYLLQHKPLAVRLLPALDCAPILKRGTGKDRWICETLISRELFLPEELVEEGYGWPGLGDRLLIPLAYNADGSHESLGAEDFGKDGMVYLYTARLVCRDKQGRKRPVLAWTVGGTATSWAASGPGQEPDGDGDVGFIDFYEALRCTSAECKDKLCGVQGPLWGYHGGMHSEDDDPDQYWRPALWDIIPIIRQLEGNQTSINAGITQVSFTGHYRKIDAALANSPIADAALLDQYGNLIETKVPRPGEVVDSTGDILPFQQTRIGSDAWQKVAADQLTLQQVTASDQVPEGGQSGHAQIVQMTTSQRRRRQVREGVAGATRGMGSAALRILTAYHHRFGVGWPIQTTQERAVGDSVISAKDLAQFDMRWVGEGNFAVDTEYPEEENLARVDMELALIAAGVGNPERVWKALGERDYQTEWRKALKWRLRNSPAYLMRAEMKLAQQTGDADMVAILKQLQAEQQMTQASVPGAKNGIPTAALTRGGGSGQPTPRAGMTGNGSDIRGGVVGAEITSDRKTADAEAALTRTGAA